MKKIISIICMISFMLSPVLIYAKDVKVKGYYRKDGTYVRPHIRSSPDNRKANNYGPSQSDDELMNPRTRDYDHDGIPNYLDNDSDNDGIPDDSDSNPYGKNNSGYSIGNNDSSQSSQKKNEKPSNANNSKKDEIVVFFKDGKTLICDKAWKDGDMIFLVVHGKKFVVSYEMDKIDMKKSFNMSDKK